MGAPDLLQHLRRLGFELASVDGGGIRVSPYSGRYGHLVTRRSVEFVS